MEFTKKGTVIITWSLNENVQAGNYPIGLPKDYPHEFSFTIYDNGRRFDVLYLTSSQALRFPYKIMEISDSRDRITVTRYDDCKEVFKKIDSAHTKLE